MLYILHRNVNEFMKVFEFLMKVYGVNYTSAKLVCVSIGISLSTRIFELSYEKKMLLKLVCEGIFCTMKHRKRIYESNLNLLFSSGIYRGLRMKQGLPSRGQRTHTNAGTSRRMRGIWLKLIK